MRRIYYVPGLISAILIPVLFWYYGNQSVHPPYAGIDLGVAPKLSSNIPLEYTFEPYRNWNYKKIIVQPNTALQNRDLYVSELKKLKERNEDQAGIEFVIGDGNTLQDLIAIRDATDLFHYLKAGLDIEKTGHFFAINEYEEPVEEREIICGTSALEPYIEKKVLNVINPESFVNHVPKECFYIIFGFLLFVNVSMFSIKENLQTTHKRFI